MIKQRLKLILILLAVLIVGSAVYLYFDRLAPVRLDKEEQITVWYVDDGTAMQRLSELAEEYNKGEGKDSGVSVVLRSFSDEAALQAAISSGTNLPNVILCGSDTASLLNDGDKLYKLGDYFDKWKLSGCPDAYIEGAEVKGELVALPVLSETDVLMLNTKLYGDTDSLKTYERLCAVSDEYYQRNGSSFYTVEDYSDFFRLQIMRLGGEFDGVNPHDSDDKNCIYIYNNLLATSALERGFDLPGKTPAKSVADGEIPCAVLSSASVTECVQGSADDIEFLPVPYMKDGSRECVERLTLLCILKDDDNRQLASCLFAEWFTSKDINTRFAEGSGCLATFGESKAGDDETAAKLLSTVTELLDGDGSVIYSLDAEYAANSIEFNLNLATLMDGLRNK